MGRKKSRAARHAGKSETAIIAQSALTAITTAPAGKPLATAPARVEETPQRRFWLEALIVRMSKWLGSLQMAVLLLSLFALVLAIGTMTESWYSSKISQELVYRTWWFGLLLFFLGINIFFAAAKKMRFRGERDIGRDLPGRSYWATVGYWWPWLVVAGILTYPLLDAVAFIPRLVMVAAAGAALSALLWGIQQQWPVETWWPWQKHQTGFLITHVGLLTMVTGGILNSFGGTDAQMVLTDSPQAHDYGPTETNRIIDQDISVIHVKLLHGEKQEVRSFPFEPGSLPWRPDKYTAARIDPLLSFLEFLAHPWPRGWAAKVDEKTELDVLAFYPQARPEQFRPAERDEAGALPAIRFKMAASAPGMEGMSVPEKWVALTPRHQVSRLPSGTAFVELLGADCPSALLEEFRNPPPAGHQGKKGQLVIELHGEKLRLDVDKHLDGAPEPLGKTGWNVRIKDYSPNADPENKAGPPTFPIVMFEITRAGDREPVQLAAVARRAGDCVPLKPRQLAPELASVKAWYHPPDYRYGEDGIRAVLQFVTGQDGKIYYRSFHTAKAGDFALEKSGEASPASGNYLVWEGGAMGWRFQVTQFMPRAIAEANFVPEDLPPGVERGDLRAALRCRLSAGKQSKEFWLGKSDDSYTTVVLGSDHYQIGYHIQTRELPFELKLLRAEQTNDPGTRSAATYTSYVQLTDKSQGIRGEDRVITMNEPLDHAGYKFYQSGYEFLGADDRLKPISRSVFTVGRDPGLALKYAGSTMLALGIACMFYMRAYFFKPRGQKALPATAPGG